VALLRCALLDGTTDEMLTWLRTPGLLERPALADGLEALRPYAAGLPRVDGLLARLGAEGLPWLVVAAALGALTIVLAVRAHRAGEEVLALTLCGLASAALAPFAWSHHYVWVVPLAVLLGGRAVAGDRRAAVGLVGVLAATVAVVTALPGPQVGPIPATGLISLWPDAYLLLFLAVLAAASAGALRLGPREHAAIAADG
jgi:alpha-1,2-mannosyltransferase